VIAQVERLGDITEAVRVFGDPWDGEQFVHASRRHDEPVEVHVVFAALRIHPDDALGRAVDVRDLAEHEPDVGQSIREGDTNASWFQGARCHLG
jgi:hypothetical protein